MEPAVVMATAAGAMWLCDSTADGWALVIGKSRPHSQLLDGWADRRDIDTKQMDSAETAQ